MRHPLLITTLLLSSAVFASEPAKVYQAIKAEHYGEIIVAPAETPEHYYINFAGFNSDYDGQTLLYKKQKNDIGELFHFKQLGTGYINLINEGGSTLISGTYVPYQTVKLTGIANSKVTFSGYAEERNVTKLKEKYKELQGLTESKVSTIKHIENAKEVLIKKCNQPITLEIDWPQFEQAQQKNTPGMLASYLTSLGKICEIDDDYLAAVNEISTIKLSLSKKSGIADIKLNGATLYIGLNSSVPNVFASSYDTILNIL